MQIIRNPEQHKIYCENSVVTIGNFDGVHNGHREIFRRMKAHSEIYDRKSVVVTFEPHPVKILTPQAAPMMITTPEQKALLIAEEGIDILVMLQFTPTFAMTQADAFVRDILCHSLGMKHVIIGHDYRFGAGKKGNFEALSLLGRELGYTVEDTEPVGSGGVVFSSSLVRLLVAEGDMEQACSALGRYFMLSGKVIRGRSIGRTIGFPTANITTDNELLPDDGVYAVFVRHADKIGNGACSIGLNPTFQAEEKTIEVFLFDFMEELYGEVIEIFFVQRLRGIMKFTGAEELAKAINYDVSVSRTILDASDRKLCRPERSMLEN